MIHQSLNKGDLLIADPSILNDYSFNKSIILLTEHNDQSSIGFILNKPLQYCVEDLLPDIACNFTIYNGGPVEQDNLYFIHSIPDLLPKSIEIANGLYWGGNFKKVKKLLNTQKISQEQIRFFLGYSGWEKNQLEDEIKEKSWFIVKNEFTNILAETVDDIWKNKLLEKGGRFKIWANAPDNINLN